MNKTTLVLMSLFLLSGPLARASGEAAWQQSHQAMQRACLQASQLSKVKVAGEAVEYDDSVGYSALLLEGRYPQKHMKNQRGRELCLFQRHSGKAVVSDADRLMPPR